LTFFSKVKFFIGQSPLKTRLAPNAYRARQKTNTKYNMEVVKMKRIVISIFAAMMMLTLPIAALAEEDSTTVTGEVSQESSIKTEAPDSFLYHIKRLYEQFRLITTFDKESKLDLHLELAEKRLQELSSLDPKVKEQFSSELYAEFLANIEEAITLSINLKEQKIEMDETLKQLEDVVNGGEEIIAQLESEVEMKIEEEDQQTRELAKTLPAVVAHIDAEIITELRSEGFGYGQIAKIVSMSEQSEVSIEEVVELAHEHKGMGKVAKELGIHPGNMNKKGKVTVDLEAEGTVDEDENAEEATEEETARTSLELEQELEVEASTDVQVANVKLNVKATGKEKAKSVIESKGKGQAKGLYKNKEKDEKQGEVSVDVEAGIGVGFGLGKGKSDK
jgi:hypothetical protein